MSLFSRSFKRIDLRIEIEMMRNRTETASGRSAENVLLLLVSACFSQDFFIKNV